MTFAPDPFYHAFGLPSPDGNESAHLFHIGATGEATGELVVEAGRCRFISAERPHYDTLQTALARFASPQCIVSRSPGGRLCLTWTALCGRGNEAEVLHDLEQLLDFLSGQH